MALIFILSSGSLPAIHVPFPHPDKIAHFCVYGALAFLLGRAAQWSWGWSWKKAACFAIIVSSVYGITDEWHQSYVPGRSVEVADWMADTIGAAVGQVVLYFFYGRKPVAQSLEKRRF